MYNLEQAGCDEKSSTRLGDAAGHRNGRNFNISPESTSFYPGDFLPTIHTELKGRRVIVLSSHSWAY